MTRKEYELVFQAFKSYRVYMTPDEEVLSEKILDDLFIHTLINYQLMMILKMIVLMKLLKMQRKHLLMSQKSNHLILGVNYEKRIKY